MEMKNQRAETGAGQKVQNPDLVMLLEIELALGRHQANGNLRIAQLEDLFGVHDREARQVADLTAQNSNVKNDHDHHTEVTVKNCRDHDPRAKVVAGNIVRIYVLRLKQIS